MMLKESNLHKGQNGWDQCPLALTVTCEGAAVASGDGGGESPWYCDLSADDVICSVYENWPGRTSDVCTFLYLWHKYFNKKFKCVWEGEGAEREE